jgi:hypothetical protein
MSLPKASLPYVNKSNQRTHLRPRDFTTTAGVAFTMGTGRRMVYSGTTYTSGVSLPANFSVTNGQYMTQQFLDCGLINIKP